MVEVIESIRVYVVCRRAAVHLTAHETVAECFPGTPEGLRDARRYIERRTHGYYSLYLINGAARVRLLNDDRELA